MLSAVRRAVVPAARAFAPAQMAATRAMATGPASGGEISDELLEKLGSLSTQALVDGLWVMGWPSAQIDNARPLAPDMKCVGRAVTLNFVPARPDIAADKPPGGNSPEYEAFELCGPNEVRSINCVSFWIWISFVFSMGPFAANSSVCGLVCVGSNAYYI
mmetsp:Transcript_2086/g.4189  ORF Transcript_2086/g.4189 Transcript_2086/m.4189 type:complete len:160 (-) Transcript_2086:3899-4378(-)